MLNRHYYNEASYTVASLTLRTHFICSTLVLSIVVALGTEVPGRVPRNGVWGLLKGVTLLQSAPLNAADERATHSSCYQSLKHRYPANLR